MLVSLDNLTRRLHQRSKPGLLETQLVCCKDFIRDLACCFASCCTKLRQVKDVHGARKGITYMAYSQRLSKIITCSGSAEVPRLVSAAKNKSTRTFFPVVLSIHSINPT